MFTLKSSLLDVLFLSVEEFMFAREKDILVCDVFLQSRDASRPGAYREFGRCEWT